MSHPDLQAAMARLNAMRAAQVQAPAPEPKVEAAPAQAAPAPAPAAPAAPAPAAPQSLAARLLATANLTRQTVQAAAAPTPTVEHVRAFVAPASTPELQERAPELVQAVQDLALALHEQEPDMGNFLKDIHKALRGEPELLHIMSDDQVAAVYQAQIAHSKVAVVPAKAKAPSKAKSKLEAAKALSDDDM